MTIPRFTYLTVMYIWVVSSFGQLHRSALNILVPVFGVHAHVFHFAIKQDGPAG